jgi:hypothetical protein
MIEAMADIETLDTKNSAVVFQIGLVIFEGGLLLEQFQWNLDIDQQLGRGRTVSASTLAFHLGIPTNLKDAIVKEDEIYCGAVVITALQEVIARYKIKNFWSKGSFDFNILESLFIDYQAATPWKYYQLRELRTLMQECNVPKGDVSHNALEDCLAQIKQLNACRAKIGA